MSTVSRRGYAPTLKIPISERRSAFPARFTGSWRRVYADAAGRTGMVETIDGTATFVRNPLIPPEAEAIIAIPYDIQSSVIKWSVSGSHSEAGCTTTYSGSGTDTAIPNTFVDTAMTLQDVHANPAAPVPEPMPFYYSIRASSDPTDAPLFTITRSGTDWLQRRQPGADHRHLPRDRQPRRPQLGDAARRDRQERRHQPARGPPPHRRRHRPTQRRHLELPGVGLGADFSQAAERTRTADPVITSDVLYQLSYGGGRPGG